MSADDQYDLKIKLLKQHNFEIDMITVSYFTEPEKEIEELCKLLEIYRDNCQP